MGDGMRRRDFISLIGGAAAWPGAARDACAGGGEAADRYLSSRSANDPLNTLRKAAFEQGLAALGWENGKDIEIGCRIVGDANSEIAAREIGASRPDILFCVSSYNFRAFIGATKTIPIIFVHLEDTLAGAPSQA